MTETATVSTVATSTPSARAMTKADDLADMLPPLVRVREMSATELDELARAVRRAASEPGWYGWDDLDIEGLCGLRRQLHSLASVVSRRDGCTDATIELDTACRIVERRAIVAVCDAQADGQLPAGDRTCSAWLGDAAAGLRRLHIEKALTDEQFAVILEQCRAAGSVTFSAVSRAAAGLPVLRPAPIPQVEQPTRSADWVKCAVRGVISDARSAAESAAGIADDDVSALDPPVAADLARELWAQMVVSTTLYSALYRRGKARSTRTSQ